MRSISKITRAKWTRDVAQEVEPALQSKVQIPIPPKKKKKNIYIYIYK
jgi:hypothetical protein